MLPVLLVAGLFIAVTQPLEVAQLVELGQRVSTTPVFLLAVAVVMVALFAFGLPGSLGLWVIAPFNPPWLSIPLLLAASLTGALGAYHVATLLRRDWQASVTSGRIFRLLQRRSDLLTQTALRMLPGFPYSVVNYAGGALRLPLGTFMAAAAVGMSVKWTVYVGLVHEATDAVVAESPVRLTALWPLVLLAVLLLAGAWMRGRIGGNSGGESE